MTKSDNKQSDGRAGSMASGAESAARFADRPQLAASDDLGAILGRDCGDARPSPPASRLIGTPPPPIGWTAGRAICWPAEPLEMLAATHWANLVTHSCATTPAAAGDKRRLTRASSGLASRDEPHVGTIGSWRRVPAKLTSPSCPGQRSLFWPLAKRSSATPDELQMRGLCH